MKALIIEVKNWTTGERAGEDITIEDIRSGNLPAIDPMHQQLNHMPKGDYEVRQIDGDRDISKYDGELVLEDGSTISDPSELSDGDEVVDVNGVIPVESEEEINKFLRAAISSRLTTVEGLTEYDVIQWLQENDLSVPDERHDRLIKAAENGMVGINITEPPEI